MKDATGLQDSLYGVGKVLPGSTEIQIKPVKAQRIAPPPGDSGVLLPVAQLYLVVTQLPIVCGMKVARMMHGRRFETV